MTLKLYTMNFCTLHLNCRGQTLVIVNYASSCAFTEKNVKELSTLANNYQGKKVKVLVFPSNSFCEVRPRKHTFTSVTFCHCYYGTIFRV